MYVRSIICKCCFRYLHSACLVLLAFLLLCFPARAADQVITECWQGLSADGAAYQECALGDFAADAVRSATGAQIALLPAKTFASALVGDGEITEAELCTAVPEDLTLQVADLTVPELKELLEAGVTGWTITADEKLEPGNGSACYQQISGFQVTYDASAPAGERVTEIVCDGESLSLTDASVVLKAAIPADSVYGAGGVPVAQTLREILREALIAADPIEIPAGERVKVIGANENNLISGSSPALLVVAGLLILLSIAFSRKQKKFVDRYAG